MSNFGFLLGLFRETGSDLLSYSFIINLCCDITPGVFLAAQPANTVVEGTTGCSGTSQK